MFELPDDDPRRQQWLRCESPIEQLLCRGLFAIAGMRAVEGDYRPERRAELALLCDGRPSGFVFTQQPIGARRVDFLVVAIGPVSRRSRTIVVEADGEHFHEEASDEARDRELVACGIDGGNILHFSGSFINRRLAAVIGNVAGQAGLVMAPAVDMHAYGSGWFPTTRQDAFWRTYDQPIHDREREEARVQAYRDRLETGAFDDNEVWC